MISPVRSYYHEGSPYSVQSYRRGLHSQEWLADQFWGQKIKIKVTAAEKNGGPRLVGHCGSTYLYLIDCNHDLEHSLTAQMIPSVDACSQRPVFRSHCRRSRDLKTTTTAENVRHGQLPATSLDLRRSNVVVSRWRRGRYLPRDSRRLNLAVARRLSSTERSRQLRTSGGHATDRQRRPPPSSSTAPSDRAQLPSGRRRCGHSA